MINLDDCGAPSRELVWSLGRFSYSEKADGGVDRGPGGPPYCIQVLRRGTQEFHALLSNRFKPFGMAGGDDAATWNLYFHSFGDTAFWRKINVEMVITSIPGQAGRGASRRPGGLPHFEYFSRLKAE